MVNLKKVLGARPKPHEEVELHELLTTWGEELDAGNVLQEHPRPQFAREDIEILNGPWTCGFAPLGEHAYPDLGPCPEACDCPLPIVVPFSPEALLSGVSRQLKPGEVLRYHREIEVRTPMPGERVILHFEAVDHRCCVWLNGNLLGSHFGGYLPFSFDCTDAVAAGKNVLALAVEDPSSPCGQLLGKQRISRGDIWYTAQSGIWQTVWLEYVPNAHVVSAAIEPDLDRGAISIVVKVMGNETLRIEVTGADNEVIATGETRAATNPEGPSGVDQASRDIALEIPVNTPHPWSPEDPFLYGLRITYGNDAVSSYCAFRKVETRKDERGVKRFYLNNEPLFIKGVLDQGYWPDGLMTAPSDEALVFDIEHMRARGFNMMRKHIKVESERWYYHCDRLGMMVWQDMVSGGGSDYCTWQTSYRPTLFKLSWNTIRDNTPARWEKLCAGDAAYRAEWTATMKETIRALKNHPSIVTWVLFNEGWGQFDAELATNQAMRVDASRPIDATSGWYDQKCGDFYSVHNYFRPMEVWRDGTDRAFVVSEFGGVSYGVEGHTALDDCYGYECFSSAEEWDEAVRASLAEVDALEDKGLAGYVYTQVSDIEEETNGLLTYDRKEKIAR